MLPSFDAARDSLFRVTGGGNAPFSISRMQVIRNAPSFLSQKVTITAEGQFLTSVQELESAVLGAESARYFIVTSRMSGNGEDQPGFMTSTVTLVRRAASKKLNASMRLNLGLSRVKAGQRFAAISSTGEVLLIGAADHDAFKFFSCSFPDLESDNKSRCVADSHFINEAVDTTPTVNPSEPIANGDRDGRWVDAFWFATQKFQVNADHQPCRTIVPCPVKGQKWAPLSELRRATGIFTRIGVPYAQSTSDGGVPDPRRRTTDFPAAADTVASPIRVRDSSGEKIRVFGDIENSDLVTSRDVAVLGVDCSSFVSALWRLDRRIETASFIARANEGAIQRIKAVSEVRDSDAFVINLEKTLNHIVVFRESRPVSQYNSSLAMLVAESSSSCGGACWTYYDESFFHGWAIIRNGKAVKTGFKAIPLAFETWKATFVR